MCSNVYVCDITELPAFQLRERLEHLAGDVQATKLQVEQLRTQKSAEGLGAKTSEHDENDISNRRPSRGVGGDEPAAVEVDPDPCSDSFESSSTASASF